MPKPKLPDNKRRVKISITLSRSILEELDKRVKTSRSRAVEVILKNYISNF